MDKDQYAMDWIPPSLDGVVADSSHGILEDDVVLVRGNCNISNSSAVNTMINCLYQ